MVVPRRADKASSVVCPPVTPPCARKFKFEFAFVSNGGMFKEDKRALRSSAPADKFEEGFRVGITVEEEVEGDWDSDDGGRANGSGSEVEGGGGVGERVRSNSIDWGGGKEEGSSEGSSSNVIVSGPDSWSSEVI